VCVSFVFLFFFFFFFFKCASPSLCLVPPSRASRDRRPPLPHLRQLNIHHRGTVVLVTIFHSPHCSRTSLVPAPCSLLQAPWPLVPAPCSLLQAPWPLVPAPCSLLQAPWPLVPAPCSLLQAPWPLVPAPCSLLQAPWPLVPAPFSLLQAPWPLVPAPFSLLFVLSVPLFSEYGPVLLAHCSVFCCWVSDSGG